jgi:hypothetical protein
MNDASCMRDTILQSWLREFGYTVDFAGLNQARSERGPERVKRELDAHAKRRADRAQRGLS